MIGLTMSEPATGSAGRATRSRQQAARERRRNQGWLACIILLLALPHAFASPLLGLGPFHLGPPLVTTGDEPHYLILINSLLEDGDIDVRNNYESVYLGSLQAGMTWSRQPLDHHTVWYEGDRRIQWKKLYDWDQWLNRPASAIPRDDRGVPIPQRRPDAAELTIDPNHPEYTAHGLGLALLLAPLLLPFRGTAALEPAAILASLAATLAALFVFWKWAQRYCSDPAWIRVVVTSAFLGTPIWHYDRTLYTEPYLVLCTVAAFALALGSERAFWSGCVIGVGTVMKASTAVLAAPLLLHFMLQKRMTRAAMFVLPVGCSVACVLALNAEMFGSPFRPQQEWVTCPLVQGLGVVLFQVRANGILPFAPVVVLAGFGWPRLARRFPLDALTIGLGFTVYLVMMALWQRSGFCYGSRQMLPVIPLLLIGMLTLPESPVFRYRGFRVAAAVVVGVSVLINFLGAVPCWNSIDKHPLLEILR